MDTDGRILAALLILAVFTAVWFVVSMIMLMAHA